MHPTTQPHQRGYRQERWSSEGPYASAGPNSYAGTTFIPLPADAPALPPPRPAFMQPPPTSPGLSPGSEAPRPPRPAYMQPPTQPVSLGLPSAMLAPRPPPSPRPQAHPQGSQFNVPSSLRPQQQRPAMQGQLADRLVNPYEQREQEPATTAPVVLPNPHRTEATRSSFGPGDPLFSAHQASAAYPSEHAPRPPLSPRPFPSNSPASSQLNVSQPPSMAQRTASSSSARFAADSRQNTPGPTHGAPGHRMDDCPGCRAEMEDAIKASLESAQQEDKKRLQEQREQEELQRIYAANAEENERQRRLADQEEQMLQKAMEDSRREAEEEAQRRAHHEEVLLEESRQHALRQREQEAQREAEMLETAKIASATQEDQRRREWEAMQDAEERAIQLSLKEQEEEWARRESAERSLLEFLDQMNGTGESTTPLSSVGNGASTSTSQSTAPRASSSKAAVASQADLEAEYWRFAGHDEAYQLALQMQRASLAESSTQPRTGSSTPLARRPLPRTPELPEHTEDSGSSSAVAKRKQDLPPAVTHPANLYDGEEDAPPAYVEAGPSNPPDQRPLPSRPAEKASSSRYDTITLQTLNRPVLQNRSSSSSSTQSPSRGSTDSPRPSFGGASTNSDVPQTPPSSNEPFSATTSPSIPQRNSSYFVPDSKRSSVSSLGVEQKGQRALGGVDFGYSSLPFAPKLDKSSLPSGASSSPSTPSTGPASSAASRCLFPASIELARVSKVAGSDDLAGGSFFVIRAPSWKSLLRAIAWYGNTRVEPSPEQVAAASDRRSRCVLRAEVEFVTPTRIDVGQGVGEHARASLTTGILPRNPSPAHVSLCLSILPGEASAWLKSDEYALVRRESRRLDAWYAGKGSTRRLIQLARHPPALPAPLVQVAQMLHASHTFSAACPSSSSTARHSPRDLHHAIERHDQGFVQKQKAWLAASNALANPADKRASIQSGTSPNEDDEDDDEDLDFGDFGLLADGSFDAQDKVLMGKRERLKAKVKRRLGKRSGDGRVVDEDLAAWITPFDVSQHG